MTLTHPLTLSDQLAQELSDIQKLQALCEKYPGLPSGAFHHMALVQYDARWCATEHRDRLLSKIGDALGRDGWTKKADDRNGFRYRRVIDGIEIQIQGAESFPESEGEVPIPPSAFPLLLEDQPTTEAA